MNVQGSDSSIDPVGLDSSRQSQGVRKEGDLRGHRVTSGAADLELPPGLSPLPTTEARARPRPELEVPSDEGARAPGVSVARRAPPHTPGTVTFRARAAAYSSESLRGSISSKPSPPDPPR